MVSPAARACWNSVLRAVPAVFSLCILMASMALHAMRGDGLSIHELVISLFLFITAPVSAYMIAKAAFQRRTKLLDGTLNANMSKAILDRKAPDS